MSRKQKANQAKAMKSESMNNFGSEVARFCVQSRVSELRPCIDGECFDYCPGVPLINHKAKYAVVVVSSREGQQAMELLSRSGYEVLKLSVKTHFGEIKGQILQFGIRMFRRFQRGGVGR